MFHSVDCIYIRPKRASYFVPNVCCRYEMFLLFSVLWCLYLVYAGSLFSCFVCFVYTTRQHIVLLWMLVLLWMRVELASAEFSLEAALFT